jgi:hypothetical protein
VGVAVAARRPKAVLIRTSLFRLRMVFPNVGSGSVHKRVFVDRVASVADELLKRGTHRF